MADRSTRNPLDPLPAFVFGRVDVESQSQESNATPSRVGVGGVVGGRGGRVRDFRTGPAATDPTDGPTDGHADGPKTSDTGSRPPRGGIGGNDESRPSERNAHDGEALPHPHPAVHDEGCKGNDTTTPFSQRGHPPPPSTGNSEDTLYAAPETGGSPANPANLDTERLDVGFGPNDVERPTALLPPLESDTERPDEPRPPPPPLQRRDSFEEEYDLLPVPNEPHLGCGLDLEQEESGLLENVTGRWIIPTTTQKKSMRHMGHCVYLTKDVHLREDVVAARVVGDC